MIHIPILYIQFTDPDRPIIQAEALCTLSTMAWIYPQSCFDMVRDHDVLDLAVTAMERHSSVSETFHFRYIMIVYFEYLC